MLAKVSTPTVSIGQPYTELNYPLPRPPKSGHQLKRQARKVRLAQLGQDYFKYAMEIHFPDFGKYQARFHGLKSVQVTTPTFVHETIHQYGWTLWNRIHHVVNNFGVAPKAALRNLPHLSDADLAVLDGLAAGEINQDPAAVIRLAKQLAWTFSSDTAIHMISQSGTRPYLAARDFLMQRLKLKGEAAWMVLDGISAESLDVLSRIRFHDDWPELTATDAWQLRTLSNETLIFVTESAKTIRQWTHPVLLAQALVELKVPEEEQPLLAGLGEKLDAFLLCQCARGLDTLSNDKKRLAGHVALLNAQGATVTAANLQDALDRLG